jgi:hypothetical protein
VPARTTRITPAAARERAQIAREHLRVADERLAACGEGPSHEASVCASDARDITASARRIVDALSRYGV